MPWRRAGALALGATLALCGSLDAESLARPNVVFVLLDTTRADHFGSWGYPDDTTPVLDALAARGVRFRRHYANSHATRPSMPQLMSGRYYRDNILAAFQPNAHPREMTFTRPDPTAVLLPRLFHDAGYATQGVSAHTWVSPDSELGRAFDRFELLPFTTKEAHGDAAPLVDRPRDVAGARPEPSPAPLRPLHGHAHPSAAARGRSATSGTRIRLARRFRPDGEPTSIAIGEMVALRRVRLHGGRPCALRRRVRHALRYADTQLGRLFAALERDDPGLRNTVVVVTADHGEELGENERIEHPPSLSDAVQHIPWIVAGGGVAGGNAATGSRSTSSRTVAGSLLALPMPAGRTSTAPRGSTAAGFAPCAAVAPRTTHGRNIAAFGAGVTQWSSIRRRASRRAAAAPAGSFDRRAAATPRHGTGGGSANRAARARHRDGARRARAGVSSRPVRDAARRVPPPHRLLGDRAGDVAPLRHRERGDAAQRARRARMVHHRPRRRAHGRRARADGGAAVGAARAVRRRGRAPTGAAGTVALRRRTMAASVVPEGHAVGVPIARHRRGAGRRASATPARRCPGRKPRPGFAPDAARRIAGLAPAMDPAQRERLKALGYVE